MSAAAPTRSLRRRERTRAALVGAARRLFAERGADGTTIQEITDAADVAKGSFYNHFDSRDALLGAVVEDALEQMASVLDRDVAARESDPARVIALSLHATLRTCLDDPTLGAFVTRHPDVFDLSDALRARGRRDLESGIASGRFRVSDIDTALLMLAAGGQALLRARLRGTLPRDAEIHFLADALRLLGVDADEALAIATDVHPAPEESP